MPKITLLFLLSPLVFLFALSLDIYVSVIPRMVSALHTTQSTMQMTVSVFSFIMGISQLVLGPLSDRYGRKRIIVIGLTLYIIGSLTCTLALNIYILVFGRGLQACGCALSSTAAFSSVKDVYQTKALPVYSILTSTIAIVPMLAPIIGAHLALFYDWQANFLFLTFVGIAVLSAILLFFRETNHNSFSEDVLGQHLQSCKDPHLRFFAVGVGAAFSCFIGTFSFTPYLFIHILSLSPTEFSYFFMLIAIVIFISSFICSSFLVKFGYAKTALLGTTTTLISGASMLIIFAFYGHTIWGCALPILVMAMGCCFIMNAYMGQACTIFKNSGSTTSVIGFIQYSLGALSSLLLMEIPVKSMQPIAYFYVVMALLSFVALWNTERNKYQSS